MSRPAILQPEGRARQQLTRYARLLYDRGYSVGSEGNISLRLREGQFLITPSRCVKHFLTEQEVVRMDDKGICPASGALPSSERFTHLEIYHQEPAAGAIVHAHPHYTVLCSVSGLDPFEKPFLIETALFLPQVRYGGFALPSSRDGARAMEGLCRDSQAVILEGHGVFCWGRDLGEAFSRLEVMEKTARMYFEARSAGTKLVYLGQEQLNLLRQVKY